MSGQAPLVVAHRGASHRAPENTMAAFALAWREGADAIETDVRQTADGRLICLHDATTGRTGDANLRVSRQPWRTLQHVDVGRWKGEEWGGERIPLLDDVLAAMPAGTQIFVEVKTDQSLVAPLARVLRRHAQDLGAVTIISFKQTVIAAARRQLPGCRAYWITGYARQPQRGAWVPTVRHVLAVLHRTQAHGFASQAHRALTGRRIHQLLAAGLDVNVWTVDDPLVAERYARLGVSSLTTNRPGAVRRALAGLTNPHP